MKKNCPLCKQEKDIEEFSLKKNRSGKHGRQPYCKPCNILYKKEHYKKNKEKYLEKNKKYLANNQKNLLQYLADKKCTDCGNNDIRVLEFDHLHNKEAGIAEKLKCWSWEKLLTEFQKCEIVCCNCHRIRTLKRSKSYRLAP